VYLFREGDVITIQLAASGVKTSISLNGKKLHGVRSFQISGGVQEPTEIMIDVFVRPVPDDGDRDE
jgi:hypothetical protein